MGFTFWRAILVIVCFLIFFVCLKKIISFYEAKRLKALENISDDLKNKHIAELKEKFKYDLVGHWTSCDGTFINIMNEAWIFYSNGKGSIISNSLMLGEDREEFRWRRKDLFCIEISYPEFNEPDAINNWIEVYYDFCKVPTDVGFIVALVQLDNDTKKSKKGFGLMEVPLSYVGKVE